MSRIERIVTNSEILPTDSADRLRDDDKKRNTAALSGLLWDAAKEVVSAGIVWMTHTMLPVLEKGLKEAQKEE